MDSNGNNKVPGDEMQTLRLESDLKRKQSFRVGNLLCVGDCGEICLTLLILLCPVVHMLSLAEHVRHIYSFHTLVV